LVYFGYNFNIPNENKIHKNNIKIITIVEIIIGIILKHRIFSAKNIFILSDFSCMSNSGEGDLNFREEKVTLSMAELIFLVVYIGLIF
jgi:hypothetical protein